MNLYAIPNLAVSVYTLILGLVVIRANPRAKVNRLCFLLTSVSFVWLFGYGIMYLNNDYDKALRIAKIGHAAAVILVPTVYWFMLAALGAYSKKFDHYLAIISIVVALVASMMTYLSKSYFVDISKHYWGYYPIGGPYMLLHTAWTFFIAIRAIFLLRDASGRAAKELQYENYLKFKYYAYL